MSGSANQAVTWSVNGVGGGNSAVGTISASGVYTAPADLPAPVIVEIRATTSADPTAHATAQATITSDIALSISPGAINVELGAVQPFQATISSSGHPDAVIVWSLSGAACPANCGSIDSSGNFTAPRALPFPATVTLAAQSAADPTKVAFASITVTSSFSLTLSAPTSLPASGFTSLTASLQPVSGSDPNTGLNWALSGAGCSGSSCGTLVPSTSPVSANGVISMTAAYTAPNLAPTPNTVIVTVTSQADPSKKAQATIAILISAGIGVTPNSATRAVNHRLTLSVQVSGTPNTSVTWSVSGIAGGNTIIGQICVTGPNPCVPVSTTSASQVDYLAPGSIPLPNPVTVQAVSKADTTKSASAQISVVSHIVVTLQPASINLAPGAAQAFTANVLGTDNQSVTWQVQGAACGGGGGPCGFIAANGLYTAPLAAPSPNTIQIVAISSEDTAQSGSASVSIATGAAIVTLLPASVYAGGTAGFTLRVEGSGFQAANPGPGSSLLIGGTARTTNCTSVSECTAPVTPVDVAAPGNLSVQMRNPDGSMSNQVTLVIVAPGASSGVVTLTAGSPGATGMDIIVVEPTTAGVSLPGASFDLNVAALGSFATATNTCTLGGSAIPLARPVSGTATADICLFALSGLDTSMTYTVSGPGDVAVLSKQPAGLGIIHLSIAVPSTATPGPRTLFVQNTNLDKTAASGALEVQ